ncbi:MAG: HEAT repeat domain-containing protein [Gemmatimonadota bacterium]|nr:HEAT repeat domain-containing protein [Gemmatimonadota bacterium]
MTWNVGECFRRLPVIGTLSVSLWTGLLGACSTPSNAPDLSGLTVGQDYDQVVSITGLRCEHLSDSGVRIVVWSYEDGSSIEAGIYEGTLSGLTPSGAHAERRASGIRNDDISADSLHALLGDDFATVDDASDRECRWRWDDGRLLATFERGILQQATWLSADGGDPRILAEVTDEVAMLLAGLDSPQAADRYRTLTALSPVADPRVADAVIELLQTETDKTNRGKAALLLAQRGDRRANGLLLQDLQEPIINVDVLRALGQIGELRTEQALRDALHRQGGSRIQAEIQSARARIRDWLGMPAPDRR